MADTYDTRLLANTQRRDGGSSRFKRVTQDAPSWAAYFDNVAQRYVSEAEKQNAETIAHRNLKLQGDGVAGPEGEAVARARAVLEPGRFTAVGTKATAPAAATPTPEKEFDLLERLAALHGGAGGIVGTKADVGELYGFGDEIAGMQDVRKRLSEIKSPEMKTVDREGRLQSAYDTNPLVERDAVKLSDAERNEVLMNLGLNLLGSKEGRLTTAFGEAGGKAQTMAEGLRERRFKDMQAQRADRLSQAAALLEAAQGDANAANAISRGQYQDEIGLLTSTGASLGASAQVKQMANKSAIDKAEAERMRLLAAQASSNARWEDPLFQLRVIDEVSRVLSDNPGPKTKEAGMRILRRLKVDGGFSDKQMSLVEKIITSADIPVEERRALLEAAVGMGALPKQADIGAKLLGPTINE